MLGSDLPDLFIELIHPISRKDVLDDRTEVPIILRALISETKYKIELLKAKLNPLKPEGK